VTGTNPGQRYWRNNSLADEGVRLGLLEAIADGRTRRLLEAAGVGTGWRCAELGAGAGSIARWLADTVGPTGSVLALDRDATLLTDLKAYPQVEVRAADLVTASLPTGEFDLVHTRNLLMHLDRRDQVLRKVADMLRPGGAMVLEEADGFPTAAATSDVFRRAFTPLTSRWTWARHLPQLVSALGLCDTEVFVETEMLQGGSPLAAFWHHTLRSARDLLLAGDTPPAADDIDQTLALLGDPTFFTPFMAVVCVTARHPGHPGRP
jgi:SAM-dependent methyltransferase